MRKLFLTTALCLLATQAAAKAGSTWTLTYKAGIENKATGAVELYEPSYGVYSENGFTSSAACYAAVTDANGVLATATTQLTALGAIYGIYVGASFPVIVSAVCTQGAAAKTAPSTLTLLSNQLGFTIPGVDPTACPTYITNVQSTFYPFTGAAAENNYVGIACAKP
jgi:hypothetical protein